MQNVFVSIQWFIDIQEYTLYKLAFWSLGLLHLKAGLAYFINPQKIDTYLSEGYSIGMTKDFGAHLWWLGCMLIALGFIEDITVQVFSCCLLCIGLLIPIIAEYQNIKAKLQSPKAYPRIILKCIYICFCVYYIISVCI